MESVGGGIFWCPRCGTQKGTGGTVWTPKLVERCREFGSRLHLMVMNHPVDLPGDWYRLGIRESIHRPEDRVS
jgi:hypothetical protein